MSLFGIIQPPTHVNEWKRLWPKDDKSDRTMQTQDFPSGSKFSLGNFLSLRVLRQVRDVDTFDPNEVGLEQRFIDQANEMLKTYKSWETYCNSFKHGHGRQQHEGNFFLARLYQDNATKTDISQDVSDSVISSPARNTRLQKQIRKEQEQSPSKSKADAKANKTLPTGSKDTKISLPIRFKNFDEPSETPFSTPFASDDPFESPDSPAWMQPSEPIPKSIDEEIINTALVIHLNATTEHFNLPQHWTMHRKKFVAPAFKNGTEEKGYEARTDGYLSDEKGARVRALIEVKAAPRKRKVLNIFMQESAQMAAWILEHPDEPANLPGRYVYTEHPYFMDKGLTIPKKSRFLVSQDRDEIYLNFAQYGEKYLAYLRGEQKFDENDPESFMTIVEAGPSQTHNLNNMEKLAPILLALTLRAVEDETEYLGQKNE